MNTANVYPLSNRFPYSVFFAIPVLAIAVWLITLTLPFHVGFVSTLTGSLLLIALTSCTFTDLRSHRIPNWVTYPSLLALLATNGLHNATPSEIWPATLPWGQIGWRECLVGAAGCFGLMFFVYRFAGAGAGDVKLATVIGAGLGLEQGLAVLVWTHVLACLGVVTWWCCRYGPLSVLRSGLRLLRTLFSPSTDGTGNELERRFRGTSVPLALFFTLATLIVVWQGTWL